MNAETILEVVHKLAGPVQPVGESHTDAKRLENLKLLCEVMNGIHTVIDDVAFTHEKSHLASCKEAGQFASKFLTKMGIVE